MKVLYAEDDSSIREVVVKTLELFIPGVLVTSCINGAVALEEFVKGDGDFDVLITDFDMPEMNGDELSKEVRRVAPHLPIVALSGTPHFVSAATIGFYKPIRNIEKFIATIQKFGDNPKCCSMHAGSFCVCKKEGLC